MNPLVPYHRKIMDMVNRGMSNIEIATHFYEHAIGPVDSTFREKDIKTITGLVGRYVANPLAAREQARKQKERHAELAMQRQSKRQKAREERERQAELRRQEEEEARRRREARRQHWEAEQAKVTPWRDRDWEDVLPPAIAIRQASWCRNMAALRMRRVGLKLDQCGYRFGVTKERVRQMILKAERVEGRPSPIEHYMEEGPMWGEVERSRRLLRLVERWTGRATVPPCSRAERRVWELYYSMRDDA